LQGHRSAFAACLLGCMVLGGGAISAQAADMVFEEEVVVEEFAAPAWSFNIAPYFWMAGLSGTIQSFGAPPVEADVKFKDILSELDFSLMVVGEARYGRFSVSTDLLYLKVSPKNATPLGIFARSIGVGNKTLGVTGLAGYALIDTPEGRLDVVAGARLWSVENTLSFSGGILNGRRFEDSATWVDAVAGVRGRANITPNIYLTGWAIAGGGSSDSTWDLLGGIGYDFNDRISGVLGYRAAGVDYQDGGFQFDVTMQGPILGAVFRF